MTSFLFVCVWHPKTTNFKCQTRPVYALNGSPVRQHFLAFFCYPLLDNMCRGHSFIARSFVPLFVHSLVLSFIDSLIRSFISFIHELCARVRLLHGWVIGESQYLWEPCPEWIIHEASKLLAAVGKPFMLKGADANPAPRKMRRSLLLPGGFDYNDP